MSYEVFFALAIALIVAALGVVLNRHPVRSALCLVATLFLLAVLFVFLDAHMVAALQIVVYAGAIMVLFLFVIMLLNLQQEPPQRRRRAWQVAVTLTASLFALGVIAALRGSATSMPGPGAAAPVPVSFGTSVNLGEVLFTQYLLPFEITSILLLVAIVGAVVLAKRRIG